MLASPGLAGLRAYNGAIFDGRWDPIITREQHELVVAILNDPSRRRRGQVVKHLLSGLVACGRDGCGAPMITHYDRGRRTYWCPSFKGLGRPGCGKTTVAAEALESTVTSMLLYRLDGPGLANALAAEDEEPGIAAQLQAAETRRDEIEQDYASGITTRDAFLRMHGPAVERVEQARAKLHAQSSRSVLWQLPQVAEELEQWWMAADLEERRAVLMAVVERVVVGPALKKSRTFDERRLLPPHGPVWRDRAQPQ